MPMKKAFTVPMKSWVNRAVRRRGAARGRQGAALMGEEIHGAWLGERRNGLIPVGGQAGVRNVGSASARGSCCQQPAVGEDRDLWPQTDVVTAEASLRCDGGGGQGFNGVGE